VKETCENCKYWQDFRNRVTANISGARSNSHRNKIELRPCTNIPCPTVSQVDELVYTDCDFSCSAWSSK
jgi:hypothetical protein